MKLFLQIICFLTISVGMAQGMQKAPEAPGSEPVPFHVDIYASISVINRTGSDLKIQEIRTDEPENYFAPKVVLGHTVVELEKKLTHLDPVNIVLLKSFKLPQPGGLLTASLPKVKFIPGDEIRNALHAWQSHLLTITVEPGLNYTITAIPGTVKPKPVAEVTIEGETFAVMAPGVSEADKQEQLFNRLGVTRFAKAHEILGIEPVPGTFKDAHEKGLYINKLQEKYEEKKRLATVDEDILLSPLGIIQPSMQLLDIINSAHEQIKKQLGI